MSRDILAKLKLLAAKRGAEVIERPNGHIQVQGALLVNWWPYSKNMTAYVAGTTAGKRGVRDPAQVVAMAFKPPKRQGRKDKRGPTSKSRSAKEKLWKSGRKTCCWCSVKLIKEAGHDNSWSLEHVIPLHLGGLDNANNRDLACAKCNKLRGSHMPELKPKASKKPQSRVKRGGLQDMLLNADARIKERNRRLFTEGLNEQTQKSRD